MRRLKKTLTIVLFTATASVSLASSPEPPVSAQLEAQTRGKKGVKLTVSRGADLGYDVEVRRQERGRRGKPEQVTVARGLVKKERSLVVEETPEAGPDGIVRVRYEVLVKSEAERFDGALVVDQAFVTGADGSLVAIDYPELMRRTSGKPPVQLETDDIPAGAPSPEPAE